MTVNPQVIEGAWTQVKGKVRERWGAISDSELEQARGDMELLVGLIQERTGEARGEVEAFVEAAAANGASMLGRAKESVASQAQYAAETAQHAAEVAVHSARAGYLQTEQMVRDRPLESLAVCFGTGLITGVVLGLLVRGKR